MDLVNTLNGMIQGGAYTDAQILGLAVSGLLKIVASIEAVGPGEMRTDLVAAKAQLKAFREILDKHGLRK